MNGRRLFQGLHVEPAPRKRKAAGLTNAGDTGGKEKPDSSSAPTAVRTSERAGSRHNDRAGENAPLLPQALEELATRWGMTHGELGVLLGITPEAVALAIATGVEPAGIGFQGALLAGAVYFVLSERAHRGGSDAKVAVWLDELVEGERRSALLARANSIEDIGTALGIE